jgi:CDP-diacylglycerol--serine O-phosphatidyltransferase
MGLARGLPTCATLANAGLGFAACALTVAGCPGLGALAILCCIILDSVDGALARSLRAETEMGVQLDSLADMVSFGVAPALLTGSLLPGQIGAAGWALVAVYPLAAAWRLARFNLFHTQPTEPHDVFVGLPTTAAGGAAATAVLIHLRLRQGNVLLDVVLLPCILAALGALMVSRIPYKHAGAAIARLSIPMAAVLAGMLITGALLWEHEFVFGAVMWGYVLSAPLVTATEAIRALRHA